MSPKAPDRLSLPMSNPSMKALLSEKQPSPEEYHVLEQSQG